MSKFILTLLGLTITVGLTACNTIGGVGQDVSAVGRDIEGGAQGVESAIRND